MARRARSERPDGGRIVAGGPSLISAGNAAAMSCGGA